MKSKLLALLTVFFSLISLSQTANAALAIGVHTAKTNATTLNGVTTDAIDTTGCTALVAIIGSYAANTAPTFSDGKGNTGYTHETWGSSAAGGNLRIETYWKVSPASVGSGHTWTTSGTNSYSSIAVLCLTGNTSSALADLQIYTNTNSNITTLSPGNYNPNYSDEIILYAITGNNASAVSSDRGTVVDAVVQTGGGFSMAVYQEAQTAASRVIQTWTLPAAQYGSITFGIKASSGVQVTSRIFGVASQYAHNDTPTAILFERTSPYSATASILKTNNPNCGSSVQKASVIYTTVQNGGDYKGHEFFIGGDGTIWVRIISQYNVIPLLANMISFHGNTVVTDTVPHVIWVTYDGSSNVQAGIPTSGAKIYVDSVLQSNTIEANTLSATIVGSGQILQVANQNGTLADYHISCSGNGYMLTLGISDLERDATYIAANSTFGTLPTKDANWLGYWPFYEGTGTTAHDKSGNGYDLTLTHNSLWFGVTSTIPSAPTAVTASFLTTSSISVAFTPGNNGGTSVLNYTVTVTGGATTVCLASPCTITDLTPGNTYSATVHATNSVGDSAESSASNSVVMAIGTKGRLLLNVGQIKDSANDDYYKISATK